VRILVTGCAGFLGFHLSERLLADGHEVVGVDNFASGQRRNATDLQRHPSFRFYEHDIAAPFAPTPPCEQIYNLACPASPVDFATKPLDILNTCARGVWNLLDLARQWHARLLHTSTSEVYGDPLVHPQPESYWGHVNPIGPRSCYDEGKRFAEALLTAYVATHGVEVRVVRIFNTYGPRMRQDDGRAVTNFIDAALDGRPLEVHGDGSQTRSFCYVSDQIEGQVRLMNSAVTGPVNIGNPDEITLRDMAREIIRLTGSRSEIRFVPGMQDDPKVRRPDITRAQRELGWQTAVPRAEGLKQTIAWYAGQRAAR
jgi:nucleoside-diphosphate-sugar epimerase